jgi:hypothetical protein
MAGNRQYTKVTFKVQFVAMVMAAAARAALETLLQIAYMGKVIGGRFSISDIPCGDHSHPELKVELFLPSTDTKTAEALKVLFTGIDDTVFTVGMFDDETKTVSIDPATPEESEKFNALEDRYEVVYGKTILQEGADRLAELRLSRAKANGTLGSEVSDEAVSSMLAGVEKDILSQKVEEPKQQAA